MRFAPWATFFLFCFAQAFSNGQTNVPGISSTTPGNASRNAKPQPPVEVVSPKLDPPALEANRRQLLADLQALVVEAQTLRQEVDGASLGIVSAQSFKRSQRIESLSKKIRKALKAN